MVITSNNIFYRFVNKYNISKRIFITYFVALSVILYFTFFTLFGPKSIFKLLELRNIIANKESIKRDFEDIVAKKKNIVDSMKPESLDIDLLDEQARKTLGFVGEKEVVIYKKEKKLAKKEKEEEEN